MASGKDEPRHWVYKNNLRYEGTWRTFFARGSLGGRWGGWPGIEGHSSVNILKTLMHQGDFVMAYQTDERGIMGTCLVEKLVRTPSKIEMHLKPIESFLDLFDTFAPIHELKEQSAALQKVGAFQRAGGESLYKISADDWKLVLDSCYRYFKAESREPVAPRSGAGAGFGSSENNKLVETAAMNEVKRLYREDDWDVEDVSDENRGYDLRCTKGKRPEHHVEVKGVQASYPQFIITRREKNYAKTSPCSVICVVTDARSKKLKTLRMRGKQFLKEYLLDPVGYFAAPKAIQ